MSCSKISRISSSQAARCMQQLCEEKFGGDLAAMLKLSAVELADLCDVPEEQMEQLLRKLVGAVEGVQLVRRTTLKELLASKHTAKVLKTRVAEFDEKTPWGGLQFGHSYGLAGEFGTGKSLFAMQAAAYAAAEGSKVMYIYTEGKAEKTNFPNLVSRAAREVGVSEDDVQSRIEIVEVANTTALKEVVASVPRNVEVVVVDSIIATLRAEFLGREHLQSRQQTLAHIISLLNRHATVFNALVIVTNQVVDVPDIFSTKRPTGGNIFLHGIHYIFMLVRPNKQKMEGYMWPLDVPGMAPDVKIVYKITDEGLY
ncbi:MAG: ATPase domain-containing protein [Pyrobaculum sp.]